MKARTVSPGERERQEHERAFSRGLLARLTFSKGTESGSQPAIEMRLVLRSVILDESSLELTCLS